MRCACRLVCNKPRPFFLFQLVHECNVQLALFRNATQGIGTSHDGASLRREVETAGRACLKACEAAKNCVLPQLRHEGVEFTRHASQFIGCVAAYVVEMKRCVALEKTFPAPTEPSITPQQVCFYALDSLAYCPKE
ncbi:hypothetical protein ANCCEY_03013 [Ancylostoma ceylanicum]|uniref:DUF19 domain-containing protein n=1 Tax=Ancylostoma ceylanicum TaxID=53326 RepID=A0A0D6M1J3_9BILA|nr:hypothetical protein ANCCEY_03013 [Ancylostoma ceylanicum]